MSNFIEIKYPKDSFKEYQKEILSKNKLELFFKMAFINLEKYTFAIVDIGNFVSLSNIENINSFYLLKVIADVVVGMIETENRYLFIGEYKIDSRYIMCNTKDKNIMMLYVPYLYSSKREIVEDIKKLIIESLPKISAHDRKSKVLEKALDFIEISGGDLKLVSCKFNRIYYDEKIRK
ncbi:MAG: hypothetical protein SOR72_02455 [Hornefia sp.]|nr:hypothetical protein [Hornefia sp.]